MAERRCRYCLESLLYIGPRGRGSRAVALLRVDGRSFAFCSPECRTRWVGVVAGRYFDTRDMRVADGVPPERLSEIL